MRGIVLALVSMGVADGARACGGFFCNQSEPVEQAAEQIVFGVESGEVTLHVQIKYAGPPSEFAWILPLPTEPTLGVGTDELFNVLFLYESPQIYASFQYEDTSCYPDYSGCYAEGEAEAEAEAESEGEVSVEFRGAVGPYDAAVITSEDATAVRTWLEDNGYDLPAISDDLIAGYVAQSMYFVALKLLPDASTDDIVPVVARFAYDTPCIPIRLTAVAAVEDMPIRAWVFADRRAYATTYPNVEINWAAFPFGCYAYYGGYEGEGEGEGGYYGTDASYWPLVGRAIDEAGGRGFVTELARANKGLGSALYWKGRFDLDALAGMTHPAAFLLELGSQGFPRNAQLLGILAEAMPPAPGWEATDFYNYVATDCYCTSGSACDCGDGDVDQYLDEMGFDAAATIAQLDTLVVTPLRESQELIDAGEYLTALATVLSPDEMTVDPLFDFSDALGDVDPQHVGAIVGACTEGGCPVTRVESPDGRSAWAGSDGACVKPSSAAAPGTTARLLADLPASLRAWTVAGGTMDDVYHNGSEIDAVLATHNTAALPGGTCPPPEDPCAKEGEAEAESEGEGDLAPEAEGAGCGCRVGGRGGGGETPALAAWLALACAIALWRRRG